MKIHATKEEIENAPEWISDFLSSAWAEPDSNGHRQALDHFDDMQFIAGSVATNVQLLRRNTYDVDVHFVFSFDENGGRFSQFDLWKNRNGEIGAALASAWSRRATISECWECGNLMEASRGKPARYCSAKCRVAAHRKLIASRGE